MLYGRSRECDALDQLLAAARSGHSGVLVLRGEPGVGKTALLLYAVRSASGFRVARAVGVESERELAFATLQQLCAPMLDVLDELPDIQREALQAAFGLRAAKPPERFLVGLAALSLCSAAGEEKPLLCVVDDAQWLDRESAQAVAFMARRLLADPVALLFATRERDGELSGLPELIVGGLDAEDARALLKASMPAPLNERVRDRIVAETQGNPLALLELPRGLTPSQLAAGLTASAAVSLSGRIEDSFRRRGEQLPLDAQRLLLLAAADPAGEPALVWDAAQRLGVGSDAAAPAAAAGLLDIDSRVVFRHPLVRSAIYRAASPVERREVHRALADATDRQLDPDRRAWHLAEAAQGPDEDVAAALERSAGRAEQRGGQAAAAAFLERSAELSVGPQRRAQRLLAAAGAHLAAGAYPQARALL
jgi:predicted ATPase